MDVPMSRRARWRERFADRLDTLMANRQLDVKALSGMAGIGQTSLRYYLTGRAEPCAYAVVKLCEALDVSADVLLAMDWREE